MTSFGQQGASEPLVRWDWIFDRLDVVLARTWEHLALTGMAVGIGFGLAMAMALLAVRWRWMYEPLAGLSGMLYAIPSVALFLILVPITGLGMVPALVALVSYTLLILLRNIVAGIDGVPSPVREAADGMGYRRWQRMLRVDLPLAVPAIIAGLRIATVTIVGLVTVAALVGVGGYGDFIIRDGLRRNFATPIMLGAVLSIVMAVVFDLLFVLLEKLATPWARRRRDVFTGSGRRRGVLSFAGAGRRTVDG
jgi:osmoprotectant transport system permease protein